MWRKSRIKSEKNYARKKYILLYIYSDLDDGLPLSMVSADVDIRLHPVPLSITQSRCQKLNKEKFFLRDARFCGQNAYSSSVIFGRIKSLDQMTV